MSKPESAVLRDSGVPSHSSDPELGFLRALWQRWSQIARALGVVQTRFLLIGFFVVVVLPTGLLARLTGDRLRLKPPKGSNWVPVDDKQQNLDAARRQF
jgi:hypothetical protein